MENCKFNIGHITVNNMERPLGTDQMPPVFGWQMEAEGKNRYQKAYRIKVYHEDDKKLMWDSGKVESSQSQFIQYTGKALESMVRYDVEIDVWNEKDICVSAKSWFETGFLNVSGDWDGAEFIGSPELSLDSSVKGVFRIEAEIRIPDCNTKGGVVFGCDDERLLKKYKNIFGVEGENYVAYVLDVGQIPALLHIFRAGYTRDDTADKPMVSVPVCNTISKEMVITEDNCHDYHKLSVEVYGNHAKAFVDDICVDDVEYIDPYFNDEGRVIRNGRQLNPIGINDVITFPRLNKVGFYVNGGMVEIKSFKIQDIRQPKAVLLDMESAKYSWFMDELQNAGLEKVEDHYRIKSQEPYYIAKSPDYGCVSTIGKAFNVQDKKIKKARLYVTARGIYEGVINGEKISEEFFLPGASQFDKHLYYQTYDMTNSLKKGENILCFNVASGWWCDAQTFTLMNYNYYGNRPSVKAKLRIVYEDASEQLLITKGNEWMCLMDGPVRYAGFYNGEHYDARKKDMYINFLRNDIRSVHWMPTEEVRLTKCFDEKILNWPVPNQSETEYVGQPEDGVRIVAMVEAKSRRQIAGDCYIYDLGQNIAGVSKIVFTEKKGQKISIRYAEMLYPKLDKYKDLQGYLMTENLRDADCTDTYICNGQPREEYMPRFTFHGYRYIEISGVQNPPELNEVHGVVLSSIKAFSGNIETSNKDINRLFENICWSQRSNFISIPTDCPQRNERLGWLGDAQVFAKTALYNADLSLFYRRYLQSIRDLQEESGRFPDVAPMGGGFGGIAWECAGVVIPWELYQQYGDIRILEENCDSINRYVTYLNAHRKNELVDGVGILGDWLATDMSTDNQLIWDCIYAYVLKLAAKIMAVLGKENAGLYQQLYRATKSMWNKTYVDDVSGKTRTREGKINDTQCSYALPLVYGIFDDKYVQSAGVHLNKKTKEVGYTVTTGFLGTGVLCDALSLCGYTDTAYKLLCQTQYPSWIYSVKQGATTIWERWNSCTKEHGFGNNNAMNSFNHYSLGAVGAWMYGYMSGIRRNELCPGFQRFVLKPEFGEMEYVNAYYQSLYGKIQSSWRRENGRITYTAVIPANTSAELILPGYEKQLLQSGTYEYEIDKKLYTNI